MGALDTLHSMDVIQLKLLTLCLSLLVGGVLFYFQRRSGRWEWPVIFAAFVYVIGNLAATYYVLTRVLDPRWSVGKNPTINAPDLPQGPIVDVVTNPLSDFFGGVTGNVNAVVNAGSTALDFVVLAVWGLALAFVALMFAKRKDRREQISLVKRVRDLENFTGIHNKVK